MFKHTKKRTQKPFKADCPICGQLYVDCLNIKCKNCCYFDPYNMKNDMCKFNYTTLVKCKCSNFDKRFALNNLVIQQHLEIDHLIEKLLKYEKH